METGVKRLDVKKIDVRQFLPAFPAKSDSDVAAYDNKRRFEARTKAFFSCGINEREKRCSFDSFVSDTNERRTAFDFMKSYSARLKKGIRGNLVLYGGTGCGKTHLSVSVLRELLFAKKGEAYGFPIYFSGSYINFTDFSEIFDRKQLYQRIDAMTKCDLCVVDEICELPGARITTPEILYRITDGVYEHGTFCILITNLEIDSFMKMLPAAAKSRLNGDGACSLVDFSELGDYRRKVKEAQQ